MKRKSGRSRGQIIEKGDSKFLVRVFVGRDARGKRKYLGETVEGTRSDAEKALTKLQSKQDDGSVVSKTKLTLGAHLDAWLSSRVDLAKKTQMDYKHRMEKDVIPFLGSKPLASITKDILQKLVTTLQDDRKLSPRTIKYTFIVLGSALESAVIDRIISSNPAQYVKLPKDDFKETEVHTPEQMQSFLARTATGDVQKYALYALMLTAGVRPQELCALKWTDITETPEGATITITRALKQIDKSKWEVGEVKTAKGRRSIPVPKETYEALMAHKRRQSAEILRAGERYQRLGFVFASRKRNPGVFLDIASVRKWWKADLLAAGLPVLKLYTSRHDHLTALLASGEHPKVAQERAGHSSIRQTMDTYSHVLPTMQQQASKTIGGLLFKQTGT